MKSLDLKGQKFGLLTVIERGPNTKKGESQWYCNCDCGTKDVLVRGYYLKNNHTSSCGCVKKQYFKWKPLINKKFGLLTVIEEQKGDIKCLCKCECGMIKRIRRKDLISGNTQSCGCINSRGEFVIGKILMENNIKFQTQYTFPDLLGEQKHPYRFDFGILDDNNTLKYLIEFDGKQHFYTENNKSWDTQENFERTQKRDKIKEEYCQKNNIPLLRIPYTMLPTLTLSDLII